MAWQWDESLYEGSAAYYAAGRLAYPGQMAAAIRDELRLDGRGRLLDVGCGPGSVTLLLAGMFEEAVGIDADAAMIAEATRLGRRAAVDNVRWVHMRAEDLPGGLGRFRVAIFAQSFHWMDQKRVADAVREMLLPGGSWIHVGATTHRGAEAEGTLPAPSPPRDRIGELVARYLGPVRRAGRGSLLHGTPSGEDEVLRGAGFDGPRRVQVARGEVMLRTEDDIVASVFSLSSAAPHLFEDRRDDFEQELRRLLRDASPAGRFAERAGDIELVVWTRPGCM